MLVPLHELILDAFRPRPLYSVAAGPGQAGLATPTSPPAHMRDLWRQATGTATSDQALTGGGEFFAPPGYRVVSRAPGGRQTIADPQGRQYTYDTRSGEIMAANDAAAPGALMTAEDLLLQYAGRGGVLPLSMSSLFRPAGMLPQTPAPSTVVPDEAALTALRHAVGERLTSLATQAPAATAAPASPPGQRERSPAEPTTAQNVARAGSTVLSSLANRALLSTLPGSKTPPPSQWGTGDVASVAAPAAVGLLVSELTKDPRIGTLGSVATTAGIQTAKGLSAGATAGKIAGNVAAGAAPALVGLGVGELTKDPLAGQAANVGTGLALTPILGPGTILAPALTSIANLITEETKGDYARHRRQAGQQIDSVLRLALPNMLYQIGSATTPEQVAAALNEAYHSDMLGQHHQRRINLGGPGLTGEKGGARVVDPRAVSWTGGYEAGEQIWPRVNALTRDAISGQLGLIEAAQAGDASAQQALTQRSAEATRQRDAWIAGNEEARTYYVDAPRARAEGEELRGLEGLFASQDWGEGSPGGSMFTGTPEQRTRYDELARLRGSREPATTL